MTKCFWMCDVWKVEIVLVSCFCCFFLSMYVDLMWILVKKQEKELLEVLELPDCGATQNTKSHSSSLDSILKAITSSTASTNSSLSNAASAKDGMTEPLSAEASAVLARLPDLSFMHSKVLMFPVSDCAN